MPIWGTGAFENDDAAAFLSEVVEDGPPALQEAFEVVVDEMDQDGSLEAPEAARAVAAAEILAAHLTGDTARITDAALRDWLGRLGPAELASLRDLALGTLDRVDSAESELADLWNERADAADWRAELERLKQALGVSG